MEKSKIKKMDRRDFVKLLAASAAATAVGTPAARAFSSDAKAKIVVIGGGAAGVSMAARLMRWLSSPNITLIDPSDKHFYQPGFTLIAGGIYGKDDVYMEQKDCIPNGVKWIKDSVVEVDPQKRLVSTAGGEKIYYDFLVLTPGLELKWDKIEGISAKEIGVGDAYCLYDYEGAIKTWQGVQKFASQGGRGIFTDTYTKHKCGGAPKKICLLTEHLSRKNGAREKLDFKFCTASKELYDVPFFTPRLLEIYEQRNIPISLNTRVLSIDTAAKKVRLQTKNADGSKSVSTESYDFLHFLPPMGSPNFVSECGLADTEKLPDEGWVDVDKKTFIHKKYPNIISLGDVSNLPTSKTSAAIRKQVPIAAKNLISIMEGKTPSLEYDGYAACPIITDYGHVLMCEFDYDKKEKISFPLSLMDMSTESRLAWFMKVYLLKPMYFYGMLNGIV